MKEAAQRPTKTMTQNPFVITMWDKASPMQKVWPLMDESDATTDAGDSAKWINQEGNSRYAKNWSTWNNW